MKKRIPQVDYRQFRLRKLSQPEFSHLTLLLGWVVYFVLYFLTENLIPAENCYPVHCIVDDWIPFCEWFVFPYILWYVYIIVTLLYMLLYNVDGFKRLSKYIIITQLTAMAIYILFPTRQDLRPEVLPRDNFPSWIVSVLYRFDTNTGVCPSLHVAYSLGIASAWSKEKDVSVIWRSCMVIFAVLVCLSTAFIKQHSVLDGLAAVPICLFAEWFCYHRKPKTA
ncbi:MAG: phosphatidic acid phosphatase [Oscillospiraceae bacterium]|nr:phosphatidic acid phosphatase [Oscillospiraceae bacterium]